MENKQKQILIVLPVYNNQSGLEETLKSLIPEKELYDIFIIDDGSTPPADVSKFPELPIILNRNEKNVGVNKSRNLGLKYALDKNYEYISLIDNGDKAINNKYYKQLKYMEEHKDIIALSSWIYFVDKINNKKLEMNSYSKNLNKFLNYNNILYNPSVIFRGALVKKIGFYSDKFYGCDDYEYWMRAKKVGKLEIYKEYLLEYVREEKSISNMYYKKMCLETLIIKLRYFGIFNIWSYLGLIRAMIILVMPVSAAKYVRKFREKLFRIKGSPHG